MTNDLVTTHQPLMPILPGSLSPLVSGRRNEITGEAGWIKPKSITVDERRQVVDFLHAVRNRFPAPSTAWLSGRIATLLAHYFLSTNDVRVNAMVASDWLDALQYLPKDSLEKAIDWWRDNETRKPKPADIRKSAIEFFGVREWEKIERLKIICALPIGNRQDSEPVKKWQPPTAEEKERVQRILRDVFLVSPRDLSA